ncbi:MAG: ABC transporter permease [Cyanobacteria bacterium M5B4]|nr:MlaE family lipid ABC transporter permease subunit [Cyanobacteria bacterium KgW148]PLS68596.1 MAG: ABC transporter permease [Cyanobacteria bacterium M5B4]
MKLTQWLVKLIQALLILGKVTVLLLRGRLHRRNTIEQMAIVGTDSLTITLVTALFVGAVFTIQVAKEFINFGAQQAIGGVLAIAITRELAPVLTAVIIAGRIGSAFAAELGTMEVTEQIDALYILRTDPIDYLVTPRIVACILMIPLLTIVSLITGLGGGMVIAQSLYGISRITFVDSIQSFLTTWDVITSMIKSAVFGALIAAIGTTWGLTTSGGAKGVGESTTSAVVTALLAIFSSNFFLSWMLFGAIGNTLSRGIR